ncbi:zeta toxin family protein [Marinobacterium rhizophilum]|uniref:Zeta toxin family protein n=1 Tax=Marinobacterium rhizophilum TaxID=420402 RepID=A0ABY5HP83_9GAMM|nr:zeta toxin family protein [Marinobacterium rhizophilum]UTW13353.1 zeta toxin family protein [Marinobacterium rhizophilum]
MKSTEYSAWNPGLEAELPAEYRALETLHRPENVFTRLADVAEIAEQVGLAQDELVAFRPERLVLHELLVRVTADIVALEGEDEVGLGVYFREIADRILAEYIQPKLASITQAHAELRQQVEARVRHELATSLFAPARAREVKKRCALLSFLLKPKPRPAVPVQESIQEKQYRVIAGFKESGLVERDPLARAVYRSLYRILGSIAGSSGFVGSDMAYLARLVTNHVCNSYGSQVIGQHIAPLVRRGVEQLGLRPVAPSKTPVLISLKGASAAGKSSLRPMLQKIIGDHGIQAGGYATISPDIWRRFLLDYDSLGEAYKYAGRLTSKEVAIIDRKLDYYIRDKAKRDSSIPHLLVDRFRFDSFSTESISRILHSTYASYVDTMLMFFVITPPHETVVRGWERGLKVGRYKAVEDFLGHSVEAYTGMPKLFFKWLMYSRPMFKYEFLDNSVPKGTYPKTIAFGDQQEMTILDPRAFVDIERYQKINTGAKSPAEVYPHDGTLSVTNNLGFLRKCLAEIPLVHFKDAASGDIYLRVRSGEFEVLLPALMTAQLCDPQTCEIFQSLAPATVECLGSGGPGAGAVLAQSDS